VPLLPPGMNIEHRVDLGDSHFYPYLDDLDRDGKIDVLFGDWHGNVWFHRNLSTDKEKNFDKEGKKLETTDGAPIKVGPIEGDVEHDFQALQGARTTLVAGDYDGDGLDDLIVGDTYGKVRYYKNVGPADSPRFAPPQVIADFKNRVHVEKADWNRDGRLDVIASTSNHKIFLILNEGAVNDAKFAEPVPFDLAVKGPVTMVTDLNRDGDDDLLINSAQGTVFVEHSFLEHGYAPAHVLKIERKSTGGKD
jgi:VCBS repeat protein